MQEIKKQNEDTSEVQTDRCWSTFLLSAIGKAMIGRYVKNQEIPSPRSKIQDHGSPVWIYVYLQSKRVYVNYWKRQSPWDGWIQSIWWTRYQDVSDNAWAVSYRQFDLQSATTPMLRSCDVYQKGYLEKLKRVSLPQEVSSAVSWLKIVEPDFS